MSFDNGGSRSPIPPELTKIVASLEAGVAELNQWLKKQYEKDDEGVGDGEPR